jgi:hypothetical protein
MYKGLKFKRQIDSELELLREMGDMFTLVHIDILEKLISKSYEEQAAFHLKLRELTKTMEA